MSRKYPSPPPPPPPEPVNPSLTIDNKKNVYYYMYDDGKFDDTFDLDYNGTGTLTLSGKKPRGTTFTITYGETPRATLRAKSTNAIYREDRTATTTITLSESEGYTSATVTITWIDTTGVTV